MSRSTHTIGESIVRGLLRCFAALPLSVHRFNARVLAVLARGYRRKVVIDNLTHAFPEKDEKEIKRICNAFYLHFADIVTEAVWFGGSTAPKLRKSKIVSVTNPEVLAQCKGKAPSTMVLISHSGNWELLGGFDSYNYTEHPLGFGEGSLSVVYRRLSSKMWDNIMRDNRLAPLRDKEHFDGYLESRKFVRFALENRERNMAYHVNTDQRPYFKGSDSVEVNFMGRKVRTMSAAAKIAQRYHYAVCYMSMQPESRGHYLISYTLICEDAAQMSVQEIMDKYYALLEADIRKQPANYLWTHKRWA